MKKSILLIIGLIFNSTFLIFAQCTMPVNLLAQQKDASKFHSNNSGFYENKGQIMDQDNKPNTDVKYLFNSPDFNVQLRQTGFSYDTYTDIPDETTDVTKPLALPQGKEDLSKKFTRHYHRVDIELSGCNPNAIITAEGMSETYYNYLTAGTTQGGVSNVHYYQKVTYKNIYPNIDLEFFTASKSKEGNGRIGVEYNFVVHPGGNPADIKLEYKGANKVAKDKGELVINVAAGNFTENIPYSYFKNNLKPVNISYADLGNNVFAFSLPSKLGMVNSDLVIDPTPNLGWGTYFGGSRNDQSNAIALDASGNIYITGLAYSTSGIATAGEYQTTFGGNYDAFVAKFNSSGSSLLWSTYYGGAGIDVGYGIAVDASNNVYITGNTSSSSGISTAGEYKTTFGGNYDVFVAKFNSSGTSLLWGTYYGGTDYDMANGITLDAANNVYIVGETYNTSGLATAGAYMTSGNYNPGFIAKFNSTGTSLVWGTYYGSASGGNNECQAIALDASGNVYVTGRSQLGGGSLTTGGAYQTTFMGGNGDAIVAKFNPSGTSLLWGTYFGGGGNDVGTSIAVSATGNVYVTGSTQNGGAGMTTAGTYQTTMAGGGADAFVAKFNPAGNTLLWGSYYGGTGNDGGYSIAIDATDNVYITGYTTSSSGIASTGAYQTTFGGIFDAYAAKFNSTGTSLLWGTYYGGTGDDRGNGIALDANANVYIAGYTASTGLATAGVYQTALADTDAFVAKFTLCNISATITPTSVSCNGGSNGIATANPSGGTSPYTYLWSNAAAGQSISNLVAGNYSVTVTDLSGCTATASVTITQPNANAWTQKTPFLGTARYGAVGFSIGTKGYIGTGYDGANHQDFWEWDQSTNVWTQKANFLGTARQLATGFSIGSKGYIGTGWNGATPFQDFWEYDPSNNIWTAKANFGGAARGNAVGFCIGTKGYIGTGASSVYYQDLWEFDPTNLSNGNDIHGNPMGAWTAKANFGGTGRDNAVGFSIGTKGYIGTGADINGNTQDFWEWDQSTNVWTQKVLFPGTARSSAVGFSIGTKGYIGTGYFNTSTYYQDFWEYDPSNNTWASKANFPGTARGWATGFSIGTKGYIGIGGLASGSYYQDFWEFDQNAVAVTIGNVINVSCYGGNNGSATATVSGNTAPYTYSWNITPVQTTQTATGLTAGNYSVTVTNANGCTTTASVSITQPANPLSINPGINESICNGGNTNLISGAVSGGTPSYNYNWSPTIGLSCTTCSVPVGTPSVTTTYTVTVTDANSCTAQETILVTVNQPPSAPSAGSNTPVSTGNTLSLTASTISGATYSWIGPNSFSSAVQNPTIASFTTAGAGCYSVTATTNGCTSSAGITCVTVVSLSITTSTQSVSCNGGNDGGALVVSVTGGSSPYTYSWSTTPVQTTQAAFNLIAGVYTVTVTDHIGSSSTATVNITQPTSISVFTNPTNVSCYGGNNGTAHAIAGGGTSPYYYSWNSFPVQTTATAVNLSAGNYTATVTDANGCTGSNTVTITQPAALTVTMTIVNTDCGSTNGSASTNVTGGTSPYTYLWIPSGPNNLPSGNYSVTVTDSKGCTLTTAFVVGTKPSNFNLAFSGTPQNGASPLPVTFTNSTPNLSNYNFSWYWGDGNNVNNNNATVFYTYNFAGTYDVALIATSIANGCTDTLAKHPYINVTGTGCGYTVSVTPAGPISKCQGDTVILNAGTNAVAPFTYQWNIGSVAISGETNSTLAVTQGGYYSVTVIKSNCPVTSSAVQVNFTTHPQQPVITSAGNIVPCLGGSVTLTSSTISGVTYSWNTTPVHTTQSVIVSTSGNYVVTATNSSGCTTASAPFTVNASLAQAPICLVTVDTVLSQNNIIVWDKPASAPIDSFIIYREISTNVYKPIGRVPYDSLSLFIDTVRTKYFPNTGNPNAGTYRYKIAVRDTCGNYSPMSLYHNTIYIINNSGTFFWPQLYTIENSLNPVTNYVLMRDNNSTGNWQQVQSVAGTQQTVTDPAYTTYQATASWRVQTQWNISCAPTFRNPKNPDINSIALNSSRSNVYRVNNPNPVNEAENNFYVNVYPNPSSGFFTIDLKNNSSGAAIITVFNMMGEEVKRIDCTGCSNRTTMDLSKLAGGVYYLQIATREQTVTKKIVVE